MLSWTKASLPGFSKALPVASFACVYPTKAGFKQLDIPSFPSPTTTVKDFHPNCNVGDRRALTGRKEEGESILLTHVTCGDRISRYSRCRGEESHRPPPPSPSHSRE